MVTRARWELIKEAFEAALKLDVPARAAFLAEVCGDEDVRAEVIQLLGRHEAAGDFLERPFVPMGRLPFASETRRGIFSPEQLVGGRFRVVRRIGEGGMGEVYEAFDLELADYVALKTIRGELAPDTRFVARFKREVQRSRAISHPNVCRVYDLFHDRRDAATDVWFLTMELLRGETLSERLRRAGAFAVRAAVPAMVQMCGALDAAHRSGVVHRDFKSGNVMLIPDGDSEARIAVTDFGLALQIPSAQGSHLTPDSLGGRLGTPSYMAPEQLRGRPLTPASDIFSLGVVLYEMTAGRLPFRGDSPFAIADAILNDEPADLTRTNPDVPVAFERLVHRMLAKRPEERPRSAHAVLNEIEAFGHDHGSMIVRTDAAGACPSASVITTVPDSVAGEPQSALAAAAGPTRPDVRSPLGEWTAAAAVPSRPVWFQWPRIVPVFALAMVLGTTAVMPWRSRTVGAPASGPVRLLAVLPLADLSGGDGYLAAGITEALTQELAVAGPLRLVSRTSVARLISEGKSVPDLARALNADAVVEGSVQRSGEEVRIALRVIHAGTNTAVWANTFERRSENILALEREVARTVVAQLQLALSPETANKWQRAPTFDVGAYDNYLRGRYERRKSAPTAYESALEYFRKSVATDPRFAPAYVAIAECYLRLGQNFRMMPLDEAAREAKAAISRALELDDTLSSAHAVQADIVFELDWNFALADMEYKRAITLDPSDVESRQSYSAFLAARGRFDEAYTQLSFARELDPLSASVASSAAFVMIYAGRYEDAVSQSQRTIRLEPTDPNGYLGLALAFAGMGRYDDAIAEASRAYAKEPDEPFFEALIAEAELGAGRVENARRRIARLEARVSEPSSRVSPHMLAFAYARLDKDKAFAWLERAFELKSGAGHLLWLKFDQRFEPLRSDPRFTTFLRRLQLAP
jgi:serine/threonine-protein kinase